jgi:hypothetical protein
MGLRNGEQDWVIPRLGSTVNHDGLPARVIGCFSQNFKEEVFGDVVRAGAGDQVPTWTEKLQTAEIDFLIAAASSRDAGAVFGEGGWIEQDHVETSSLFVVAFEEVKGVGFAE